MSELAVGKLKGLTVNSNVISVPTGHTLTQPGMVLQCVTFQPSAQMTHNSTSWVNTTLTGSITPKFANSKILIQANTNYYANDGAPAQFFTIFRGTVTGTNLGGANGGMLQQRTGTSYDGVGVSIQGVDTPNTTSLVTYTVAARQSAAAGTVYIPDGYIVPTLTLWEIAA